MINNETNVNTETLWIHDFQDLCKKIYCGNPGHPQDQPLVKICALNTCKQKGLICDLCQKISHVSHQQNCIELEQFQNLFDEFSREHFSIFLTIKKQTEFLKYTLNALINNLTSNIAEIQKIYSSKIQRQRFLTQSDILKFQEQQHSGNLKALKEQFEQFIAEPLEILNEGFQVTYNQNETAVIEDIIEQMESQNYSIQYNFFTSLEEISQMVRMTLQIQEGNLLGEENQISPENIDWERQGDCDQDFFEFNSNIAQQLRDRDITNLVASNHIQQIKSLNLSSCRQISSQILSFLLKIAPPKCEIINLNLENTKVNDFFIEILLNSNIKKNIETLNLQKLPEVTTKGWENLMKNMNFPSLSKLYLDENVNLTDYAFYQFTLNPIYKNQIVIHLQKCSQLTFEIFQYIFQTYSDGLVMEIDFSHSSIDDKAIGFLQNNANLQQNLVKINFSYCFSLTNSALISLFEESEQIPSFLSLESLNLSFLPITDQFIDSLQDSQILNSLQTLNLNGTKHLSDEGFKKLFQSFQNNNLKTLQIGDTFVSPQALVTFLNSDISYHLQLLCLFECTLVYGHPILQLIKNKHTQLILFL